VVAVLAWMFLIHTGVSLNPDMTTKVLQVPFTQFSYSSISPDGNWVAFPAAYINGRWDFYFMNVNGGEPRKITSDATSFAEQTDDISPDGSQLVYTRLSDDNKTFDIFVVSALGGTSRKVATGGDGPFWKPDGQRIGFIRGSYAVMKSESGMMELWTVNALGSDARREYVDSLFVTKGGNYRFSFCWSPDGNSIGWIRSFSPSSQVIIVHDLKTGNERQLTDGNENIDSIVWTVDGQIVFSSNRGGNTNLWTVPVSGGKAVQITKGAGPDIGISVSHSGKKLLYLQQQHVGFLWTEGIDGTSPHQISFDERGIEQPTFSPDGKQIAFVMADADPLKVSSDLYMVDADGGNRRRLTIGNAITRLPLFSQDGSKIIYSVPPTNVGSDTSHWNAYVVDITSPGPPQLVGQNIGRAWLDNDHVLMTGNSRSYLASLSGDSVRPFFSDSLIVWSVLDMHHLAYFDIRGGKSALWVVETEKLDGTALWNQKGAVVMPVLKGTAKKILASVNAAISYPSQAGFFLQFAGPGKIRRIWLNSGKAEVVPSAFAGLSNGSFNVSADGRKVVYVALRLSSRLVLLQNVFN
jgi:Tol biopolymer transport system component